MSAAVRTVESAPDRFDPRQPQDDPVRTYHPANAHERMLATQISQAWLRLETARKAEQRYFQKHDILESIETRPKEFQAITRFVTDCERAWRYAVASLEKSQRLRRRDQQDPPRSNRTSARAVPPVAHAPHRPEPPCLAAAAAAQRE